MSKNISSPIQDQKKIGEEQAQTIHPCQPYPLELGNVLPLFNIYFLVFSVFVSSLSSSWSSSSSSSLSLSSSSSLSQLLSLSLSLLVSSLLLLLLFVLWYIFFIAGILLSC